jgi:hypothetical protein
MMNQTENRVSSDLALKANVVDTYPQGTIDNNTTALQDDTETKLALKPTC